MNAVYVVMFVVCLLYVMLYVVTRLTGPLQVLACKRYSVSLSLSFSLFGGFALHEHFCAYGRMHSASDPIFCLKPLMYTPPLVYGLPGD